MWINHFPIFSIITIRIECRRRNHQLASPSKSAAILIPTSTWPSWTRSSTTATSPVGRTTPPPVRSNYPSTNSTKLKYPPALPSDMQKNIRNLLIFIRSRSARWMMVIENYGKSIVKLFRAISNTKNLENTNLSRTKIAILLIKLSRRIKITFSSRRSSKREPPLNMTKAN